MTHAEVVTPVDELAVDPLLWRHGWQCVAMLQLHADRLFL